MDANDSNENGTNESPISNVPPRPTNPPIHSKPKKSVLPKQDSSNKTCSIS